MAGGKGAMSEYLKKYMSEPEQPKKKKKKKLGADGALFPMHSFIAATNPACTLLQFLHTSGMMGPTNPTRIRSCGQPCGQLTSATSVIEQ
jgi:hypothetical protein